MSAAWSVPALFHGSLLDGRAVEASMRVPPVGFHRSSAPSVALIMPAPTSTTSVLATFGSDTGSLVVRVRAAGTLDARRGPHSSKSCRSSSDGPIGDGCAGSQVCSDDATTVGAADTRISKAVHAIEQFQVSLQFWAHAPRRRFRGFECC